MKALVSFLTLLMGVGAVKGDEGRFILEMTLSRSSVQVGDNIQVNLRIKGGNPVDLWKDSPSGGAELRNSEYEPEFQTNIGYEPKTPGVKKIGPFEMDFQGQHLKSNIAFVEVREAWSLTDERYEVRVFPRKVTLGQPIRVVFVQQYSRQKGPFLNNLKAHEGKATFSQSSEGVTVRSDVPTKHWTSRSGMSWGDNQFCREEYWFDVPTSKIGKMTITREDLPSLPENVVVDPIEVDVTPKLGGDGQ